MFMTVEHGLTFVADKPHRKPIAHQEFLMAAETSGECFC